MDPITIAGLTTAGVGLATGVSNAAIQGNMNAKTREFANWQADKAYERQRTLIAEERAYNDPSAVRERLEAAGLNPALANINGSVTTGGTTAPQGETPHQQAPRLDLPNLLSIYESMANIKNIEADSNYKNSLAGKTNQETDNLKVTYNLLNENLIGQRTQNDILSLDYQYRMATLSDDIALKKQTLSNTKMEFRQMLNSIKSEVYKRHNLMPAQLDLYKEQIKNSTVQRVLMGADIRLKDQMTDEKKKQIEQLMNDIYVQDMTINDQIYLSKTMAKIAGEDLKQEEFDTVIRGVESRYSQNTDNNLSRNLRELASLVGLGYTHSTSNNVSTHHTTISKK